MVEFPEESLAHHHCGTGGNRVSGRVALFDLPEQYLLPDIRGQSFPGIGPNSQRYLRDLLSFNSNLSLPRNETNTNAPRTGSLSEKEGPRTEDTKALSTTSGLAAQSC